MLVEISSHLSANEHVVEQLRTDKVTEVVRGVQNPPLYCATNGTSRWHTHRREALAEPWYAIPEAVVDIYDVVRVKVTNPLDEEHPGPGLGYL